MDTSLQALHNYIDCSLIMSERDTLRARLMSLGKDFKMGPILEIMRSEIDQVLAQYRALFVLVLTLPTTVFSAERSFSGLTRIKSKLRTTLSQIGKNSYAIWTPSRMNSYVREIHVQTYVSIRHKRMNLFSKNK